MDGATNRLSNRSIERLKEPKSQWAGRRGWTGRLFGGMKRNTQNWVTGESPEDETTKRRNDEKMRRPEDAQTGKP